MEMRSEGGFALVLLIPLLPLLLVIACTVALLADYRLQFSKSHHICRTAALNVQLEMSRKLQMLLKLNSTARSLRQKMRAAKLAAATPGPHQKAAIVAVKTIQGLQFALHVRQKLLLSEARIQGTRILLKMRRESSQMANSRFRIARLAVRPIPPNEIAPEYIPEEPFETHQAQSVQFRFQPGALASTLIRTLAEASRIPFGAGEFSGECSATLRKEGSEWVSTLGKGRSLWRL